MSLITGNESKIFANGVIGNVRKAQEDSHGWKLGTPNGDLFVVCDGMGGHVGGAMASRLAVDSIVGYIDKEQYATPIEALDGALQFANMQILGYADAHPEYRGMGTTACLLLIRGNDVWIAHVGDSRIYLYLGKEKQLHRITKDHSYVQTLVDAGQITDEEAEHHPNKNRILKALGIKPELHPTFNHGEQPIHPKNGDVFLICSDGLSGMIPDSTIERVLGEKLTLQQRGDLLINLAMQGETVQPGGQDNCTLELIEIDNSKYKTSEFKSYNPNKPIVEKEPSKNRKPLVWILAATAILIVLGVTAWMLNPHRLDRHIARATQDTVATRSVMDSVQKEYEKKKSNKLAKLAGNDSVTNQIASASDKIAQNAEKFKKDEVDPVVDKHNAATKKLKELQDKRQKLQGIWDNLIPQKKDISKTNDQPTKSKENKPVEIPQA